MALEEGAGRWEPLQEGGEGDTAHRSPGDSGHVSHSHSVCSSASAGFLLDDEATGADYTVRSTASQLAQSVLPAPQQEEIENLEKSLEELLIRVDEFVGMLDMIRNDTSQVVNERVPHIYAKAAEMRKLYQKIDLLETFVKKVGGDVSVMEEQLTQAEANLGTFPNPLKKIFQNLSASPLFSSSKVPSSPKTQQIRHGLPTVFKTEDYFPSSS
ncbi:biogenesis of lysosome-related organelles complex 1 subunit 4-like [Gastrophryne carolinensis]